MARQDENHDITIDKNQGADSLKLTKTLRFDVDHLFSAVLIQNGHSFVDRVLNEPSTICKYFRSGDAGALWRTCT